MLKILILIFGAAFFIFGFVRYFEAHAIFHPTKEMPVTPSLIGLPFEDIYFKTKDGLTLNGWFVKAPQARTTFLFFHGNAGNISHRLEKIALFYHLGVNVFIIDYRGYGKSEGLPNEEGLYKDTLAAYDYLLTRDDVDRGHFVCYGDSLGGVAAVYAASQRSFAALVVDSSFSSSADMSKTIFPFVPTFFLKTRMDSASRVKTMALPKLFIHSINDEIIPFRLGKKLFDAACAPKEFLQITGGHNTSHVDSREKILSALKEFLKRNDLS